MKRYPAPITQHSTSIVLSDVASSALRRARQSPFGLFFCILSLAYLVTCSGYVALSDGASMVAVSNAFIHGHIDVPCKLGVPGVADRCFSIYGPGWSLAALPPYALGVFLERYLHLAYAYSLSVFAVSFVNPILIAATAYVLAKFVYSLTGSARKAILIASIFALATPAWALTKDAFSEPLVMLLLVSAGYLLRHSRQPSSTHFAAAGALLGLAILTRMDILPAAIAIVGYGIWPNSRRKPSAYLRISIPVILSGVLLLAYNWARFGDFWRTGYEHYGSGLGFHRTPIGVLQGLIGILGDPTHGLIWFVPTALLSLLFLPRLTRWARAEGILCVVLFLITWVEHANVFVGWQAGWAWGPRFLMPVLPYLMLPLSVLPAKSIGTRVSLVALSGLGLIINLAPVLVTYARYFYADLAGLKPGWPQIYLWQSAVTVIGNGLSGHIPSGRIAELAPAGSSAILNQSTSLNAPDFWWIYLLHAHVHPRLVLLTLSVIFASLIALVWTLGQALGSRRNVTAAKGDGNVGVEVAANLAPVSAG